MCNPAVCDNPEAAEEAIRQVTQRSSGCQRQLRQPEDIFDLGCQ